MNSKEKEIVRPENGLLLSVDIDSLHHYLGLYGGVVEPESDLIRMTWELGVVRFLELFAEFDLPALFFVVGQDLEVGAAKNLARTIHEAGHELGNHTQTHPYDFIRLPASEARQEVLACHHQLHKVTGRGAGFFRAPGYNMTTATRSILLYNGYRYDASPLPSPFYLAVKYAVMSGLRLRGKRSRSIWGEPRGFLGPRQPYLADGMAVLPCAVSSRMRLPIIGTTLSTAPRPLFDHLLEELVKMPFVSLEFHAVDLMELGRDKLPGALRSQRDLSIPLARKYERFREVMARLAATHQPFLPRQR
jgi:hypothetical protein